jgi:adenosine deaminase
LGADRIDHGVRAVEDDRLVEILAERRIPLGVCPTSNLALKLYSSIEAHPIDRLRKAGVMVSVNTDDPSLLSTNLPAEYSLAAAAFGWDDAIMRGVAMTSISASFANPDVKAKLNSALAEW